MRSDPARFKELVQERSVLPLYHSSCKVPISLAVIIFYYINSTTFSDRIRILEYYRLLLIIINSIMKLKCIFVVFLVLAFVAYEFPMFAAHFRNDLYCLVNLVTAPFIFSLRRQIAAIDKMTSAGMAFWDYGNAFLLEASRAGCHIAFRVFLNEKYLLFVALNFTLGKLLALSEGIKHKARRPDPVC